jgi:hypothetical protein
VADLPPSDCGYVDWEKGAERERSTKRFFQSPVVSSLLYWSEFVESSPMSHVPLDQPAYAVPLRDEELASLGYFSAIWSQLDYWTGITIAFLLSTDIVAAETFMENMTTGPRINLLRRLVPRLRDDEAQKLAKGYCKDMSVLIEKRNHLLHGIWGWSGKTKDDPTFHAASYYPKRRDETIFASELVELCTKAARQTHVIIKIQRLISGYDIPTPPKPGKRAPAFFFGPKPPPGWPAEPSQNPR